MHGKAPTNINPVNDLSSLAVGNASASTAENGLIKTTRSEHLIWHLMGGTVLVLVVYKLWHWNVVVISDPDVPRTNPGSFTIFDVLPAFEEESHGPLNHEINNFNSFPRTSFFVDYVNQLMFQ